MILKIHPGAGGNGSKISLRCPSCKQLGIFDPVGSDQDAEEPFGNRVRHVAIGHRRCPNLHCSRHVFVALAGQSILASYPPERIDFDSTDLPPAVVSTLEEAITCHANQCFIAAAMLLRKTLEHLCDDRGAKGNNLKERIRALATTIVLPKELLDGVDDIRLLGNDAAHIESRDYENIGKDELEIAIDFAKEVLTRISHQRLRDGLREAETGSETRHSSRRGRVRASTGRFALPLAARECSFFGLWPI